MSKCLKISESWLAPWSILAPRRQVKHRGYEWQRGGRCLTIFSAANYIGRMGNLGAAPRLTRQGSWWVCGDLEVS